MHTRTVLVIANHTVRSQALREQLMRMARRAPSRFILVMPADPGGRFDWATAERWGEARSRLQAALADWRAAGLTVEGRVGDADPFEAAGDVLAEQTIDEVVVSTLPAAVSPWVAMDLPNRLSRFAQQRVIHVTGSARTPGRPTSSAALLA